MSGLAVLLCSGTGLDADAAGGVPAAVVDELCTRPGAAAAALRSLDATRVVLGLCERRPSGELVAALRRAGTEPFGIEAVPLEGQRPATAAGLVAAAAAKLDALAPGERHRPLLAPHVLSRRSLFSLAGVVTQASVAVLDEAACAGTARCGLCVRACPERAIDGRGRLPVVDAGACSACAACVTRCPSGALHLAGSSSLQLEAQLAQLLPVVDGVVFACAAARADAPSGWALVELPTLALLTPGWILQVRSRGVDVRLAPCDQPCCAGAQAVEAFAARVLAACEEPQPGSTGRVRLAEPAATVDAVGRLAPHPATAIVDGGSPVGVLSVDAERCTLCSACSAACPAGALRLDEPATETVLVHDPRTCVACARCAAVCPEDALEVTRGLDVARLRSGELELVRAERQTCTSCGADLPSAAMRRRLRELLPGLAEAPLQLCTACALDVTKRRS